MIAVLPYVTHPKTAVLGRAGGGKRQNKREKTRNFLISFVKILVKRAKKLG